MLLQPARLHAALASDKHFLIGEKLREDGHRDLRLHDFIFPYNYTPHSGVSRFQFLLSLACGALNGFRPIFRFFLGKEAPAVALRFSKNTGLSLPPYDCTQKKGSFSAELGPIIDVLTTLRARFVRETRPEYNDGL